MLKNRSPKIDRFGIVRLPFPAEMAIETHSYCNLQCVVCPYPEMDRKKGIMAKELFHKIVDEVAEKSPQTRLWLAIMGEPLADKNIISHCRYAIENGAPRIHLNTNGTFFHEKIGQELIDVGVESIYVAIDAVTKETYDIVRPGGDYERVVRNVETFLDLREKHSGKVPELSVQIIVMDENESEIDQFVEFWQQRGAVVKIRLRQGWGREITTPDLDNVSIERIPCPWLIRTMNVHWTGDVTQCDADFEQNYPAGNLNVQTIQAVWEDELAKRRQQHWEGDYSMPICRDCLDWAAGRAEFIYPNSEIKNPETRFSVGDHKS